MKNSLLILISFFTFTSCQSQEKKEISKKQSVTKVQKTEAEWKEELTPQQYEVLRNKGTERPFTGEYYNHFEKGNYVCAACGNILFHSNSKFNSDCGWPSFDQAIKGSVTYKQDNTFGMARTEVMCAKCGGHLGHVFDDGPKETTGKRFCTNSISIKFVPTKKS